MPVRTSPILTAEPDFDELDKVYLWGLQVFGDRPGPHMAAFLGFGADGDQEGWETFLATAERIFNEYGDLPFVHWSQAPAGTSRRLS